MNNRRTFGKPYRYSVFGLNIQSDLELPECDLAVPGDLDETIPDVTVRLTTIHTDIQSLSPKGDHFEVAPDRCLVRVPGVARYLIEYGSHITIEAHPKAERLEVRAYFLGTALGALLHQRRMIPLHVSVVESNEGLIAFSGPSGAGKSTIAAALHLEYGWPILTDDLAVLSGSPGTPKLLFGVRRLRLWNDAISNLQVRTQPTSRVIAREDKFQFDLVQSTGLDGTTKLRAIFLLGNGPAFSLSQFSGHEAFSAMSYCVYRPDLAALFNNPGHVLSSLTACANSIELHQLIRPIPSMQVSEVASRIVAWSNCRQ